jgi:Flp pilus assembly protein TadG
MTARPRRLLRRSHPRRGATIVEMAIVGPLAFLMVIGLMIGCLGIFRYNQVAALAHEGARWAAVRGRNFEKINHRKPITAEDIRANVIVPRAAGINLSRIDCTMSLDKDHSVVSVTVRYLWLPEAYFGKLTLSDTATMLVSN